MGSKPVVSGITVTWNDVKHPKLNVKDGGRYKNYKKGDLKSDDDELEPDRVVVDLKLDLGNPTTDPVNLDDVHVRITYSGANPKIGWWNGTMWKKFTQVAYAKNVADVTLPSPWPVDPPIGTG